MTEERSGGRKRVVIIAVVVLLLLVLALMAACSFLRSGSREPSGASTNAPAATSPTKAVSTFYGAKRKHGYATFHSGDQPDERVEFWFDGGRYRLTWYRDDKVRIHMISPDGKAVYHCKTEDRTSVIAYVAAEKQQWTFNGPPGWTPDAGVAEGGYTVFTYSAKKLWDIEGASQQFYLEDLKVYAKGDAVEKIVMRTSSSKVPEAELVESSFTIDEVDLDADIPSDVFDLPYPVAKAE